MAVRIFEPAPWCPDCMAAQMEPGERVKRHDETTLAVVYATTWTCPRCDKEEPDAT